VWVLVKVASEGVVESQLDADFCSFFPAKKPIPESFTGVRREFSMRTASAEHQGEIRSFEIL